MQNIFIQYVYLILIILALVMIANKLRIAYPIVLVLGGLVLSFTSAFSNITIDPELIFFIFLPPLLYEAAWQTSWKEFWRWKRVIMSFAFPIVILTSCVVAFSSYALIPGFTLALGFLLGGIVSPPDAISATAVMRQVNAPRILVSVAEGESLLNDASSLIVFRFALAAVITGQFHFSEAAGSFFLVIIMGTVIGLVIGFIFYGNSPLSANNTKYRNCFEFRDSILHVLLRRTFSLFRSAGGGGRWSFVVEQTSADAHLPGACARIKRVVNNWLRPQRCGVFIDRSSTAIDHQSGGRG